MSAVQPIGASVRHVIEEIENRHPELSPYSFAPAFPPGHFVQDYLDYAAERTDAAYEFHEAGALIALAIATPNVRATLAPYPAGLPTNLYVLGVGPSTTSRKSTAKNIAQSLVEDVSPFARLADLASPEAFIE